MKKNGKFQMGTLIDLYKYELNKGREYLYNNLEVFISGSEFYIRQEAFMDIKHSLFMILDEVIQKSVDEYGERQIYNYIRKRVRGHLINCKFGWEEGEAKGDRQEDFDYADKVGTQIMSDKVKEYVLQLPEEQKTVILMRLFSEPPFTNKEIASYLGKKESHISRTYKKTIEKIKKVLAHLSTNEDLY